MALWCSHSVAQASQASAQVSQIEPARSLPRAMQAAARRQISAQSMSSFMQRAMLCTSFSAKHDVAQWSQAVAQALQASMQDWNCSCGMGCLLWRSVSKPSKEQALECACAP
jgi:hypothetical protein